MSDWGNIIHLSRRHKPYIVHQMTFSSFFDLTPENQLITNRNKDTAGETVNLMKIHSLRVCKDEPFTFQYSYKPMSEYQKVVTNVARGRRAKPTTLMPLYTRPLGISKAKKMDLIHLCQSKAIPAEVQHWYMNLSVETDLASEDVVDN